MKLEKPGKYIFFIHDEGLEFNIISQVVNFFHLMIVPTAQCHKTFLSIIYRFS
jgi:hypothetical protein